MAVLDALEELLEEMPHRLGVEVPAVQVQELLEVASRATALGVWGGEGGVEAAPPPCDVDDGLRCFGTLVGGGGLVQV